MITLGQMRTFQVVARRNSFSKAAAELNLSQPAVSTQILALEKALGVDLFDRVGRKILLTSSGRALLAATDDVLTRIADLRRELRDLGELKAGSLCVGGSQVVGVYLLPDLLATFQKQYPAIQLTVRVEPARQILDLVLDNELDVALIGEGVPLADGRIVRRPVLRDELIVIVPAGHVFAQLPSIPVSRLSRMPFLLPRLDSASSQSLIEQLAAEGIQLQSVLELGNVGAVKRAVEAGLGISIVSHCAVQHELADGRLRSVQIADVDLQRQISLVWHGGRPLSRPGSAFVDHVARQLPDLAPRPGAGD